ncbi:MAG: FAD-binding oxidoreductase [Dehalococcoidia bacterium]|nr:FAD-binding oxidoreductase [Dehalococcoidia bacterium]
MPDTALPDSLIESLTQALGQENVLTDPYDLDRYSGDALSPTRAFGAEDAFDRLADVVARPGSTEDVCAVLKLANASGTPVIPYGGGTGVMGATVPALGGIILDLQRMNKVLAIDSTDMTAEVEAGVVMEDLENALALQGLMPGHDPYSVPIATVAGTISTNGVGYRAGAHGPMGDQVVALEVVLADGRIMSTRAVPNQSSGPSLKHLFIGSEGVFGVITKATIRVFRLPEVQVFSAVAFDTFDQGFNAAAEMFALGVRPTLVDLTEEDDGITFHLLFEGFKEGVEATEKRALSVCTQFGGRLLGPGPTTAYWEDRRQSAENYKVSALGKPRSVRWSRWRGRRGFDYLHLGLPISKVLEYRKKCDVIMAKSGVRVVEYAIWSRPELFSMLIVPESGAADASSERLGETVEQVLKLAQDMGGVMEYCHGVGVKLNHLLAREMGVGQDVVGALKLALDPNNVMNPGKLGL